MSEQKTLSREEAIEYLRDVHGIANDIMKVTEVYHPGVVVAACAMASGSIGTVCSLSKEEFMEHVNGMVGQAWDRQLEAQAAQAKDHGPLQ